jgi:hypothetical protein
MSERFQNDRLITDGFPEGWKVQDRVDEGTALLCVKNWLGLSQCICLRPKLMSTDAWLPTARSIANQSNEIEALRAQVDRYKAALEEAKDALRSNASPRERNNALETIRTALQETGK